MKALAGKTAWITGAGRGIGRAVALAYASAGAKLVLVSRTQAELDSTAKAARKLGAPVLAEPLDIRHLPDVQDLLKRSIRRFGSIDILVNNAAVLGPRGPLVEASDADWAEVLAVNLSAAFRLTREVLAVSMQRRGEGCPKGLSFGCVINVSSSVGRRGRAGWGPYAVSKFGLEGMTQVWAEECPDVRFYTLNPNATRTRMRAEAYPDEDPATLKVPEEVGKAFVRLAAPSCRIVSGSALELDRATGKMR